MTILMGLTGAGYLWAAVLSVAAFYDLRRMRWAEYGGVVGWLAQTGWLVARGVASHGFPFVTLYDWMGFFVWASVFVYGLVSRWNAWRIAGGFLFPIMFVVWLVSQTLNHRLGPLPTGLSGPWLDVHIALATLGDVSFLLSAIFGIMYIEKERELKQKNVRVFYYRLPPLGELDQWSARLIGWGWPLLTLAMVTGAIWAKMVWGQYWSWSPKEVWSLLTWAVYAGYLAARWGLGWRGRRAAYFSMLAFLAVLVNFWAINLWFHGPHNYNV